MLRWLELYSSYSGDRGFPLSSGPCVNAAVAVDFAPGLTCANVPIAKGMVHGSGYGQWNGEVH